MGREQESVLHLHFCGITTLCNFCYENLVHCVTSEQSKIFLRNFVQILTIIRQFAENKNRNKTYMYGKIMAFYNCLYENYVGSTIVVQLTQFSYR